MFKGRHFDRSVILLCVRWYLAYGLSLRNLEEMMAEPRSSLTRPFPSHGHEFDREVELAGFHHAH